MISALQRFFAKHKFIMPVLLGLLAIVFIFGFTNFDPRGISAAEAARAEFYGYQLNSPSDQRELQRGAMISQQLAGARQLSPEQLQQAAFGRAVALYLADAMQIPEPSEEVLKAFIQERPGFQNPESGEFDPVRLERMRDQMALTESEGEAALRRAIEEDWRIEQVIEALSGPGYASDLLARIQVERNRTLWDLELATLDRSSFNPEIAVDEEKLATFYDQRQVRYEIPALVKAGVIRFAPADFVDQVKDPTEAVLAAYFAENREEFAPEITIDDAGTEETEDATANASEESPEEPDFTLDDVRDAVLTAWKLEQAERVALAAASTLSTELYNRFRAEGIDPSPEDVAAVVAEFGYESISLEPINPKDPAAQDDFPRRILTHATDLGPDRPYSDLIPGQDGVTLVFVYEGEVPAVTPPLEEVREAVEADFRQSEADRRFVEQGQAYADQLRETVANEGSFTEKAEELGLRTNTIDDFSLQNLRQIPPGMSFQVLQAMMEMSESEVSDIVSYGDAATVIYVVQKTAPEIPEEELTDALENQRARQAQFTAQGVLFDLVQARINEIEQANRVEEDAETASSDREGA